MNVAWFSRIRVVCILCGVVIFCFGVWGLSTYNALSARYSAIQNAFASSTDMFEKKVADLEAQIATDKKDHDELLSLLQTEKGKNDFFDFQIKSITTNVNTLQKLSQTDKELLQKYSKVYFLNENYIPASLLDIGVSGLTYQNKPLKIHTNVWPFLQKMLQAMQKDGVATKILSAYRSFGEQTSLKTAYRFSYGTGANKFSADQGYSEHQLGTTVDLTTDATLGNLDKFKGTSSYTWLLQHAHEYGFILSYPEGNDYYVFEPWHWRFVGVALATKIFNDKGTFYGLDQRIVDGYLANIFDGQ